MSEQEKKTGTDNHEARGEDTFDSSVCFASDDEDYDDFCYDPEEYCCCCE